jgi:hypothetical protein
VTGTRLYVSGPLQASSDLARARHLYELVASTARDAGFLPYLPHLSTDPEHALDAKPEDVYAVDSRELLRSAVVVAHVGSPSTGVGAELAIAAASGIEIVAIAAHGERISRFAEGLIVAAGGLIIWYDDQSDLRTKLSGALTRRLTTHAGEARPRIGR